MGAYDTYIEGWRERRRQAQDERDVLAAQARRLLPALVRHLVEGYGVRRVVLTGSLAEGGFGPGSDIDLAVEGLQGADLYRAGAQPDDLALPFRIDLVPIEDAYASVRRKIEEHGEVLHEA